MNMHQILRSASASGRRVSTSLALICLPGILFAWPPAPPHTIFGTVRNEFGATITRTDARIVFETLSGASIETRIIPGLATGVNYELLVPMDAGLTADLYRPNAMLPLAPFRLKVLIGNQTYLPIEMSGDMRELGKPAASTRIDLTLGIDSDGDGIPDAWKDSVIAMMGGDLTRDDIHPSGDIDSDGISNYDEYIAGTYAWDANDRPELKIIHATDSRATLEFLAIDGRTYFIEASSDLRTWTQIPFRIPAVDAAGQQRASYLAAQVRHRQVEVNKASDDRVVYRLGVR